jgi:soluble lytic murein transglycosylase
LSRSHFPGFGLVLLLAGIASAAPVTTSHAYRLAVDATEPSEAALREAFTRSAFGGAVATAEALKQVSAAHPGSATSGLAQLAAGLLLLDAGKPADALPLLRHPDVTRTALVDYAVMGQARALEATNDLAGAGSGYLSAAETRPGGPLACSAFFRAAEALTKSFQPDKALEALNRTLTECPGQKARALLAVAALHESRRDLRAAASAYERIEQESPAAPEAREATRRLASLGGVLTPLGPEERAARELKRGLALFDSGRWTDAIAALRPALGRVSAADDAALGRLRLGRALSNVGRLRDARHELASVPADSPHAAEAAFYLARLDQRVTRRADAFEDVAARFPGTAWAEEALLALANEFQKDYRNAEAVPYFRRLLDGYPEGRYADRATWRVAWADYRAGRYEDAARVLERAARLRSSSATAGFLYWAGRARREQGQSERARQLLEETVRRFKFTYYGLRAAEVLAQLPRAATAPAPVLRASPSAPQAGIPEAQLRRVRQLLLVDRLDEARDELDALPPHPQVTATAAWIEWRRGRLRPAIAAMKRAYPEAVGEAGAQLPDEVWRILYPIEFSGLLQQKATEEGLDPALVAALICQESTFDPGALSRAGARGLMQVIPKTGLTLAKSLRVPYRSKSLYDPAVSLDFGTRYLREMLDRFGGRVERALAAYNAGPHRVDAWTRDDPEMSAEEFVESIPFTETRNYVITILGSRDQYRRIYSFPPASPQPAVAAPAAGPAASSGHP